MGEDFFNFKCKITEEVLINTGCKIPTTTEIKIPMCVYMGAGKILKLVESLVTK